MADPFHILLTNSSDIYAGGEFYVLELARTLQARGHSVHVCCKPTNLLVEKCRQQGISVLLLDFPPQGRLLNYVQRLRAIVRHHGIQIVHTNTNYDRTAGAFAAKLEGAYHVTNVHSFHSLQHNITHWLRNKFATNHFMVDGDCVKDLLVREDGIPPDRISVVHLGVDPDRMRTDRKKGELIRREFGLEDRHIVIGNVARLVPFKGHETLLRAFATVADSSPDARLLLVGDGELREPLRSLALSLRVKERVLFAGFRDDLQSMYSAFDIYSHPSIEGGGETFPFAVLQALSQELPVVVTDVGDVAVMVEEGVNGFVVEEKNSKDLADRLLQLAADGGIRSAMGQESRKRLLDRFTLKTMVDMIEQVYLHLSR